MTVGERATQGPARSRLVNWVFGTLPYVSVLGLAGVAANVILSFEEPHTTMLVASGLLLAAAPVGMLAHLAVTSALTRRQRELWIAGLLSRNGASLFAAYFRASDRRRATRTLDAADRGAT